MNKAAWQDRGRSLLAPAVTLLERFGVTPVQVTLFGLALHVSSAVIIGAGQPRAGGLVLLLAAACDGLDGMLARRTGTATRFGAFLDSTVDRVDETLILAGVAAYFLVLGGTANLVWSVVVLVALGGSLITSYTRARAEGLGLECRVGAFERPERVIVTVLGLLLGRIALVLAVLILTGLAWYTVYQRVRHVERLVGGQPLHPTATAAAAEDVHVLRAEPPGEEPMVRGPDEPPLDTDPAGTS